MCFWCYWGGNHGSPHGRHLRDQFWRRVSLLPEHNYYSKLTLYSVALQCPSNSSGDSHGSLRELVEDSEPLIKESPRAARLLAANKTQLCFTDSTPIGSPDGSDNIWLTPGPSSMSSRQTNSDIDSLPGSRQTNSDIGSSPTPRPTYIAVKNLQSTTPQHRRISLADIKRSPPSPRDIQADFDIFLQPAELSVVAPVDNETRDRADTVFSNPSNFSMHFDQKTYKELFNNINDKIELVVRKHVGFRVNGRYKETAALIDFSAYHVNYDKVNIAICRSTKVQPALVHGMIWRLVHDLIFATPVLDQAPSPYAETFLYAWTKDVLCCTVDKNSHDWNVKGPLMNARVAAVRAVIETTPGFNGWIKTYAAIKTDEIVKRLAIVWRHGRAAQVHYELYEPISKLVRVAIRMRGELKHFDFQFLEYGLKARGDKWILHNVDPTQAPPLPSDGENQHVVLTKSPEILEKDHKKSSQITIYKAEVVVSNNLENSRHLEDSHKGRKVRGFSHRAPRRYIH